MNEGRDIRRCALQALYQLDALNPDEQAPTREALLQSLEDSAGSEDSRKLGVKLALEAWQIRSEADAAVARLAPAWPTHRQPAVDRSILRLGYFEIVSNRTPPKVAVNEAIELAREFSTEKSPAFINGILDKVMRQHRQQTGST